MKIPERVFVVVNAVARLLLRSPLHFLMSDSLLVINYVGRKSGRAYATPVRYQQLGSGVRCFTSKHVQWWRNVNDAEQVTLLIAGKTIPHKAQVLQDDPARIRPLLEEFLALYPQDATYQDITFDAQGRLNEDELRRALAVSVVVEFHPLSLPQRIGNSA
jgi:deazaflavin-dependent oxidoreductase (nitroreductase family)